jgi:hypothetical protein
MTYEDEHGTSGRLAADDEYGTPPEGYGAQQYEPAAPDRRGESGPDWRDMPDAAASGAPDPDAEQYEYWPSIEPAADAPPGGWPSAGGPPAEVAAALDYATPRVKRPPGPGGLHAPLPAGENAYVDWIKGLGTADAVQEQWATVDPGDGDLDDGDLDGGDLDGSDLDGSDLDEAELDGAGPREVGLRNAGFDDGGFDDGARSGFGGAEAGSAGDWPDGGAMEQGSGGDLVPAGDWAATSRRSADQPGSEDENWFEPKTRSDDDDGTGNDGTGSDGTGSDGTGSGGTGPGGGAGQFAPALPAAGGQSPEQDENWFEPKARSDGPDWSRTAIAAHSAAPVDAPSPSPWGSDWPRSADELDFVTPDQAGGGAAINAGFGAADYRGGDYRAADHGPTEYQGGGYGTADQPDSGYPDSGQGAPDSDDPGAGYGSSEYAAGGYGSSGYGSTDYRSGDYPDSYDGSPDGRPDSDRAGGDSETTMLLVGGGRKEPSEQRRKARSYRPFAIVAVVLVAAMIGLVGVALHDSSAQSANPGAPQSTGNPAPPPADDSSPSDLSSPTDSLTASPVASVPTAVPTSGHPVRTTATARPPTRNPAPPPPTHHPTPTPPHSQPPPQSPSTSPSPSPSDGTGSGR